MLDFGYYNMDCMQGMKEFPDVNRMLKPSFIPFKTKAKYFSDIERSSEWFLTI